MGYCVPTAGDELQWSHFAMERTFSEDERKQIYTVSD